MTIEEGTGDATSKSAYMRLEPLICDLVRLCEMTDNLNHEWLEDAERGPHAVLMSELLLEKVRAFKGKYYAGFGDHASHG